MGKWGTKITIVAGTKDKKAPIQILKENYNILKKQTTTASFVELPNTKHNFLNLPTNTTAIIEIIKHQRI